MNSNHNKNNNGAYQYEPMENIVLKNPIFNDKDKEDIKQINKHEIIVKIAEILGNSPCHLSKAEEIFEKIIFSIANYVLNHEYNSPSAIPSDLLIWLDSKSNPGNAEKLNKFILKYLK